MARRILLADDSVTAQNMGRRILTDAGYEVVTVNNGSAALKKIAENKPDIVVLDVYMPGYGGLEVCQRIKESTETARIPVLLTVGKLEPFKPDEARRVGADAFIIKPFEATELLTALTKLEDKIVASPQPQKSGRFARALAAVEGADFGDKETGWKNRLTIPGPNAKSKPAETDTPEVAAGAPHDLDRDAARPVEARQEFERPIPAGLPADITPEEIAAITAAAASFDGKAGHPTIVPEGSASESVIAMQAASAEIAGVESGPQETPAATLASNAESITAPPAEVVAESASAAEAVSEVTASVEAGSTEENPAATELPAATAEAELATQAAEAKAPEIEKPSGNDAEVMAAIASLAPSNGQGGEGTISTGTNGTGHEAAVAVTSALAADAGITGPRWIAELVAITAEESALSLGQEMEQASAARATAEATRSEGTIATAVEVSSPAAEATESAVAAITDAVTTAESLPAAVSAEAENVAVDVPAVQGLAQEVEPAIAKEESAYAAAASAGAPSDYVPAVEAVSATTASPEALSSAAAPASVEVAPQREAELAAAWQNWKQIRESFVSASSAVPSAEASVAPSATQEDAPAPASIEEAGTEPAEIEAPASEASGESTAIASIVDTMLAELRPKLVEEIAKKMNSEKKEKEKEKEKEKKKKK